MKKILPTITTTYGSDWREKIKEIDALGIEEVAVFLTCLEKEERKELYGLLEKTNLKSVPFVHLRSDIYSEEIDYFVKRYNTKAFNIHTSREFPFKYDRLNHKDKIYMENVYHIFDREELKEFKGICLDLSHLENDRLLNKERYKKIIEFIKEFEIGCNHISAIKKECEINENNKERHDFHHLDDLSELDYLKKYPLNYFSSFIAIELENSLKEQLEIKKYLENILSGKI